MKYYNFIFGKFAGIIINNTNNNNYSVKIGFKTHRIKIINYKIEKM